MGGGTWRGTIDFANHTGLGQYYVQVFLNGSVYCDNANFIRVVSGPWWRVKDGDITTGGNLNSSVPAGLYLDVIGDGGYPGIPAYGGTTNITGANVSVKGWLAASQYSSIKIYNSAYYLNAIPADAVINPLTSTVDGTAIASGGTATNGIYWYEYDPTTNGGLDLTINTAANLGSRKVILVVKGADALIKGDITLTKGSGFFMLVAGAAADGSKGNIIVDPGVGGGAGPNLEGIYVADKLFQTGSAATQLTVRGTVAAYGGISLQRDLGGANPATPAEVFEFAPDLELLFPGVIGARTVSWQEVAP
jgi:hypothetical protein